MVDSRQNWLNFAPTEVRLFFTANVHVTWFLSVTFLPLDSGFLMLKKPEKFEALIEKKSLRRKSNKMLKIVFAFLTIGENNEPPNEPLPPVAYGNQTY